jgi:hypothetical protein
VSRRFLPSFPRRRESRLASVTADEGQDVIGHMDSRLRGNDGLEAVDAHALPGRLIRLRTEAANVASTLPC